MRVVYSFFLIVAWGLSQSALALVIGSKSAVSTQSFVQFPSTDSNNWITGFVDLEQGFGLQDSTTTCTFEGFLSVAGDVLLNGGNLFLRRDFVVSDTLQKISGGIVIGNNNAFKMPVSAAEFLFPYNTGVAVQAAVTMGAEDIVYDLDWSFDNQYVAAGLDEISSSHELKIGYFNGSTITSTVSAEINNTINGVRWHPAKRFIALALRTDAGDDLNIYEHRVYNGTLVKVGGSQLTGSAYGVAWHSSGNYLAVGTNNTSQEIISFPVNANGSVGSGSITNLSSNQTVYSLSFSPGGNQLAAGTSNSSTTNISELYIFNFNGSLTLTTSLDVGATVQALDWSATGTYVAAGLLGVSSSLRIYDTSAAQVKEIITARQNIGQDIYSVAWDKTGSYLLVGAANGVAGALYIFYFDKTAKTLTRVYSQANDGIVYDARWSRDNSYIAYGGKTGLNNQVFVVSIFTDIGFQTLFQKTNLVCNGNLKITQPLQFSGTCKINGKGYRVNLADKGAIVLRPNSGLILEDVVLDNVRDSNLRCLTNTSSFVMRNCVLILDRDFTFSQGSILFDANVVISGTNKFNYTSKLASSIAAESTLFLTRGITFSYAPSRANQDLFFMTNKTSQLYLDGCTVHSTRTGLHLQGGRLVFDDKVTLSSEAKSTPESFWIDSNLDVVVRSGAQVEAFGSIRYL